MKKGFTVIELIVSFVLVSAISVILFELIFTLKELYISGDIKTTLLNRQGIMTKKIYDDLNEDTLESITSCGVSCLIFKYQDEEKKLLVDVAANTLTYGNYTMKLIDGSYFDQLSFEYKNIDKTLQLSEFTLIIPIKSRFLDDDFGIRIVKTYNPKEIDDIIVNENGVTINNEISVANATITANGIDLPLRMDNEINEKETYWAKIFHQDHKGIDINSDDAYFKNANEFEKSNNPHKFSSLKSLEVFRIPADKEVQFLNSSNILETINLVTESSKNKSDEEINKIKEQYQNGYFELLLEYENINEYKNKFSNYNLWTQTNNFVNSSTLENAYAIDRVYLGGSCSFAGLKKLIDDPNNDRDNKDSYVNGCPNGSNFAIGTKTPGTAIKGPGGDYPDTVDSVNLWINADEYISKYSLSKISLQ